MSAETHTFLFADISGYSLLAELDGDEAAANVALALTARASCLARAHRAEVIKCLGDGVMVRAGDAGDAVQMGLDLLASWREDSSLPPLHIGVHTGPALRRADDWWGSTVNTAARVAAAADAGQLLLTDATRVAAGPMHSTRLRALGRRRFKNMPFPIEVFEARPSPSSGGDPRTARAGSPPGSGRRLGAHEVAAGPGRSASFGVSVPALLCWRLPLAMAPIHEHGTTLIA
jgi:adenylate cyclase